MILGMTAAVATALLMEANATLWPRLEVSSKNLDGLIMFNPTQILIEGFIRELRAMYNRTYGALEPGYPGVVSFVAQLALENIATSDAAYHDVNHTIMVTLVGQEILRGRHISVGGVTPRDWLHFIISLLCHDIGYVRGICQGEGNGLYVTI
jgi:hypothetical protein